MTSHRKSTIVDLSESTKPTTPSSAGDVLKQVIEEARSLKPGSDVEGFLERRLQDMSRTVRQEVARERAKDQSAASMEADFPPSGLPEVRHQDAPGADGIAPDPDDVGPDRL